MSYIDIVEEILSILIAFNINILYVMHCSALYKHYKILESNTIVEFRKLKEKIAMNY